MQFKEMTDDALRDAAELFTKSFNSPPKKRPFSG